MTPIIHSRHKLESGYFVNVALYKDGTLGFGPMLHRQKITASDLACIKASLIPFLPELKESGRDQKALNKLRFR